MIKLILKWAGSAAALYLVTLFVPGVRVSGVVAAFVGALAFGFANATLGNLLKLLTLPIGCLTLGISRLVINALMFLLAAYFVKGFQVDGFLAAFLGAIAMAIVGWALDLLVTAITEKPESKKD
jgi:putative membrane protein